jgi:hypothetical protein
VSPVKYELGFYITEDVILYSSFLFDGPPKSYNVLGCYQRERRHGSTFPLQENSNIRTATAHGPFRSCYHVF